MNQNSENNPAIKTNQSLSGTQAQIGENPLGKQTVYPSNYDPSLLYSISRTESREKLQTAVNGIGKKFFGRDIWNLYEVSWWERGIEGAKPRIAVLQMQIDASSSHIVESKSLKLYLNSLNQKVFSNRAELIELVREDVSKIVYQKNNLSEDRVYVKDIPESEYRSRYQNPFFEQFLQGDDREPRESGNDRISCRDLDQDFNGIEEKELDLLLGNAADASFLHLDQGDIYVQECVKTTLFRSLCPITGQPDWASIIIQYLGKKVNDQALMRYLLSYRNAAGYHEETVEKIFNDLQNKLGYRKLCVAAFFTRRGGIDINVIRFSKECDLYFDFEQVPAYYRQ